MKQGDRMAKQQRRSNGGDRNSVRIDGREYAVLDRIRVNRRTYLVLEKGLGNADRQRMKVYDPHTGPGGDLRSLMILPVGKSARQHVRVMKNASNGNENLPSIHDYQIQQGNIYVVSAWVRGPDVESFLAGVKSGRVARPSISESFRLFRGLAHGLSHLHRRHSIVHGDIKPSNLILARDSSRLVMIDYGSSWTAERTRDRSEGDGISRAYAAPELQEGESLVDFRSDQFSATVLLYELLTLRVPYDGLGGQAGRKEFKASMSEKLDSPTAQHPDRSRLPRSLCQAVDNVIRKGLQLEADSRFTSPNEWLDSIQAVSSQFTPQSQLSATNSRMTPVVEWCALMINRFRR